MKMDDLKHRAYLVFIINIIDFNSCILLGQAAADNQVQMIQFTLLKCEAIAVCAIDEASVTFGCQSQGQCVVECQRRSSCVGVNYRNQLAICELFFNGVPNSFRNVTGCQYFQKGNIDKSFSSTACDCLVNALSWGLDDTSTFNGHVAVGGTNKTTNGRGFNFVELDVSKCSMSDVRNFDTCGGTYCGPGTGSTDMANYINGLPASTVLIGVTADDASTGLETNGKATLLSIGVDATLLAMRGKVAFVAQVGRPALALMKMGPAGGNNVKITVNVQDSGIGIDRNSGARTFLVQFDGVASDSNTKSNDNSECSVYATELRITSVSAILRHVSKFKVCSHVQ